MSSRMAIQKRELHLSNWVWKSQLLKLGLLKSLILWLKNQHKKEKENVHQTHQNEMFLVAFEILEKSSSNVPIEDSFNSFALHVANEILPYVKRDILDVLFKADTGGFNHLISSSPAMPSTSSAINHPSTSHNPSPSTTTLHYNYRRTSTMPAPPPPTTHHTITFNLDEAMHMIDHQEEL
ncbi:uncharacterized protein LOC120354811 [Nilaparvata lugens]|uniref:uncharacterized protein LOC120354811 n=1 Tax=Nilaparvata lugens TaxID=108931 RepID=UPI00193D9B48|nr:uncharacterized protein LOC120354811 [Nilaparvata lugens]